MDYITRRKERESKKSRSAGVGGDREMWVSKKKWASLEKRVTALEEKLQEQSHDAEIDKVCERMAIELSKASLPENRW